MTLDLHYTDPRLALLYDQDCGWGPDSAFYLGLAGNKPQRILDLGCGTGILCNAYAGLGHQVTGVDPAPAMLDVARNKPFGAKVEWVNDSCQTYRSNQRFDLIVMTGHAFQVLLSDNDIRTTFKVMYQHLVPKGRVAFESRNPAIDWKQRWHGASAIHRLQGETVRQSYDVLWRNAEYISFETRYEFPQNSYTSRSTLRLASHSTITKLARAEGLALSNLQGDWYHGPFEPLTSEEMIFVMARGN